MTLLSPLSGKQHLGLLPPSQQGAYPSSSGRTVTVTRPETELAEGSSSGTTGREAGMGDGV